ncbi:chitinase [Streptomyces sp. NRRL S-1022]|uniref:chitinase n=1 Tax=Streptomyces sp. NRRL S-1022 TaxID=1463880 RepID=UPI0004C11E1E|nr:chitinase [Streptomyces sp. NRRL S-1022]
MRRPPRPAAAFACAVALAATGCSGGSGSTAAVSTPRSTASSPGYAPYVSATEAAGTDSAGSPGTYNLAFVLSGDSGCTPKWDGTEAVSDSAVTSRISALKKNGGTIRVSFGGSSGKELAATCDNAAELATAYAEALDAAGSTAADFDIEGDELTDSASVGLRSRAIARLQEERPDLDVSFTLPVMPSGLDADGLALLESANTHDVQVSTVNLMTMNYGESYDGDMGDYAVTSAKAAHAQLRKVFGLSDAGAWRGMALTSMIGVNDVAGETFTLADAGRVRAFAERKGIAWVSMWSAVRDRPCGGASAAADASTVCSGVKQEKGAFARAFTG